MGSKFDDDFASFDIDLTKYSIPAEQCGGASFVFGDFDLPQAVPATTEDAASTVEPSDAVTIQPVKLMEPTEAVATSEEAEDEMGMEASFAEAEQKRQQSKDRLKELKGRNPYRQKEPKEHNPQDLVEEMMQVGKELETMAATVEDMEKRIAETVDSSGLRPKGLKSTLRRMDDYVQVMRAAQAIVNMFSKTGRQEVVEALTASRVPSIYKKQKNISERKEPKVKAVIDELAEAMTVGDKEQATAVARQLKKHAMNLQDDARQLADALFEATSNYPDADGQLALFSIIADQGEADDMAHIDHTMRLTGQVVVPVAEAKAMLEARANGDQQTIDDILDRVITRLVEDEKQ